MAPILSGQSLVEVHREWTIDDVAEWHEAMEIKQEAEAFAMKRAKENAGR